MPGSRVLVIIVNWNGKAHLLRCLESVRNEAVLVVDNASTDGSVEAVELAFPSVEILQTGANLGFTGGTNIGLTRARQRGYRYACLLNPDATLQASALQRLVEAAEADALAAVVTPVIHRLDGTLWLAGTQLDLASGRATHLEHHLLEGHSHEIPWASGCVMLLRLDQLHSVGDFDNRFFFRWEDVDLCIRLRRAGFHILLQPAALAVHDEMHGGRVPPALVHYYNVRNNLLLVRIHTRGWWRIRATFCILRAYSQFLGIPLVWRALLDHLMGRYGPLRV